MTTIEILIILINWIQFQDKYHDQFNIPCACEEELLQCKFHARFQTFPNKNRFHKLNTTTQNIQMSKTEY